MCRYICFYSLSSCVYIQPVFSFLVPGLLDGLAHGYVGIAQEPHLDLAPLQVADELLEPVA